MDAKLIVEAGTWMGDFAEAAAKACPNAKLLTADPLKVAFLRQGNIFFYQGDFSDMLTKHIVGSPRIVDFAFIDSGPPMPTDAFEDGIRIRHFHAVLPYMRPGGIVAVHDMATRDWQGAQEIADMAGLIIHRNQGISLMQVVA